MIHGYFLLDYTGSGSIATGGLGIILQAHDLSICGKQLDISDSHCSRISYAMLFVWCGKSSPPNINLPPSVAIDLIWCSIQFGMKSLEELLSSSSVYLHVLLWLHEASPSNGDFVYSLNWFAWVEQVIWTRSTTLVQERSYVMTSTTSRWIYPEILWSYFICEVGLTSWISVVLLVILHPSHLMFLETQGVEAFS